MSEKIDIREIFLLEFIRTIVKSLPVKPVVLQKKSREEIIKSEYKQSKKINIKEQSQYFFPVKQKPKALPRPRVLIQQRNPQINPSNIVSAATLKPIRPLSQNISSSLMKKETVLPIPQSLSGIAPSPIPLPRFETPVIQSIEIVGQGMNKIKEFLMDSSVTSVECAGPGKPVILTKNGTPEITNLNLSEQEINSIMKEISEKSRIPLQQGVFRAALGNIVTTAVISDYVGTRFVIQKREQFMPGMQ